MSAAAPARPRRYAVIRVLSRSNSASGGSAAVSALSLAATRRRRQRRETPTPSSTPNAIQSSKPVTAAIFGRRLAHRNRSAGPGVRRESGGAAPEPAAPLRAVHVVRSQKGELAVRDRAVQPASTETDAAPAPARQMKRLLLRPAFAADRRELAGRRDATGTARSRPGQRRRLVGAARFELATPCTPCKCATRLRHAPTGGLPRQSVALQTAGF
jgi:hypothetical protein